MKNITLMVGPAGAGKSTLARQYKDNGYVYINQDSQGRQHLDLFEKAIKAGEDVIIDRMGFTKQQRSRYLDLAKKNEYKTEIVVLHQSYDVCLQRCITRQGHETIKEETAAHSALNMFFSKYERVTNNEANVVRRLWPEGNKPLAIVCDLDGTLCNVEHRRHFVKKPEGERKDWKGFFDAMSEDGLNGWCQDILKVMAFVRNHNIVLCSGRPDNYKRETVAWLKKHEIVYDDLFMRLRSDSRHDNVVKENILDFEILTRYTPYFMIDDRDQVVKMWRSRGYTCLQCDEGNF